MSAAPPQIDVPPRRERQRLGEELPVFCERCGYSLHGLPPVRCEHCTLLQFACPECGHRQPINTLRPAALAMLGRLRAAWLTGVVAAKAFFFIILGIAWTATGTAWSYTFRWDGTKTILDATQISFGWLLAYGLFGAAYGLVARLLVLRWRRHVAVGAVLGALVASLLMLGGRIAQWDRTGAPSPYTPAFLAMAAYGGGVVALAAAVAWALWRLLVLTLLPPRLARPLLDWMASTDRRVDALERPILTPPKAHL